MRFSTIIKNLQNLNFIITEKVNEINLQKLKFNYSYNNTKIIGEIKVSIDGRTNRKEFYGQCIEYKNGEQNFTLNIKSYNHLNEVINKIAKKMSLREIFLEEYNKHTLQRIKEIDNKIKILQKEKEILLKRLKH